MPIPREACQTGGTISLARAHQDDGVLGALLRATERRGSLLDTSRAVAWFFRILRRKVADHHAMRATRERKLGELAATIDHATPEEIVSRACALGFSSVSPRATRTSCGASTSTISR